MNKNRQTFSITGTAEILVPDKLGRTSYLVSVGIIILMIGVVALVYGSLPHSIPMYFSLPWGESRLAPKIMLLTLPAIALLFSILNIVLGRISNTLSPILPRVLAVASTAVSAMLLIAVLGIIQSLIL
jgi:hypothetical protein